MSLNTFPRLIADIGGTNARFCIETTPYTYECTKVLKCKDYTTLAEATNFYLKNINIDRSIRYGAIALPTPIVDDVLHMVNSPWHGQLISKTLEQISMEHIKEIINCF